MTKIKTFRSDFGVYLCPHVFRDEKPILEVIRDFDGDWQFFCGETHDVENEDCHYVCVGHLLERDTTINILANMEVGTYAERETVDANWQFWALNM